MPNENKIKKLVEEQIKERRKDFWESFWCWVFGGAVAITVIATICLFAIYVQEYKFKDLERRVESIIDNKKIEFERLE